MLIKIKKKKDNKSFLKSDHVLYCESTDLKYYRSLEIFTDLDYNFDFTH